VPPPRGAASRLPCSFEVNDEGMAYLAACPSLTRLAAGSFYLERRASGGGFARLQHLSFGGSYQNKGLDLLFPLPALRSLHVQVPVAAPPPLPACRPPCTLPPPRAARASGAAPVSLLFGQQWQPPITLPRCP